MVESTLSHAQLMQRLRKLALEALRAWPVEVAGLRFLNLSENAVYEVTDPEGRAYILRLHRPGYQSEQSIRSEMFWLDALSHQTDIPVPRPVRSRRGQLLEHASTPALPEGRFAVLFVRLPGRVVGRAYGAATLRKLGSMLARLHNHAEALELPAWFTRQRLDAERCAGPQAIFGDPLEVPDLNAEQRRLLSLARDKSVKEVEAYAARGQKYGLIHNDLHFYNLLTSGGALQALDFDDCAFNYWMVDLMIAVRMTRKRPDQARLRAALVEGYRQHRALEGADLEVLGALGVVSLNMGLAWCHSRRALPRVQKSLPAIIKFTLEANRRYLEGQDPLAPPLPAA